MIDPDDPAMPYNPQVADDSFWSGTPGMPILLWLMAQAPAEEVAYPDTANKAAAELGMTTQEYLDDETGYERLLASRRRRWAIAMMNEYNEWVTP